MRSYTCEKYCNTKRPYKYQEVMKLLSMNKAIIIILLEKGCDVVIKNGLTVFEKYFD